VGPFLNTTIAYQYDALGRVLTRAADGNTETYSHDPLGRLAEHADDLGAFAIGYLRQTAQPVSLHSPTVGTARAYHRVLPC